MCEFIKKLLENNEFDKAQEYINNCTEEEFGKFIYNIASETISEKKEKIIEVLNETNIGK